MDKFGLSACRTARDDDETAARPAAFPSGTRSGAVGARAGKFEEYNKELFRALFERGEDIGDIEVLRSLASDVGMNADSLKTALENHDFLESVLRDEHETQDLGMSGIRSNL